MVRFLELISIYMGKNNKYRNWMVAPMNEVNELFTKENVEQIVVPQIVKDDLLSIIEQVFITE